MENLIYNKAIICPVCSKEFEITKVKSKACKVASRDTDMCVYYEGLNPILYDIWVCENCGYAAQSEKFEGIPTKDAKIIFNSISKQWNKRSFAGKRSVDNAIEAFKIALYNMHLRKAKSSEVARLCIRIAWMYRMKNDEKEKEFLQFALRYYMDAYEKERFPIEKLDEFTCMYMIAELHRRVGNFSESIKWFSKLVGSQEARRNAALIEMARDQFMLAKEQQEKAEGKETEAG